MTYYNENDPRAAAWLRELISRGLIAPGIVDERSILDVRSTDLSGYAQCHFFAGIGGWSYALRLAGWPDDKPVWTGSCPCQPFSAAGKGLGTEDPRHLWPEFRRLIKVGKPAVVFGEQVASKAGRGWLSGVRLDLEALGYAVGAADLCAAGSGAPHIRQRLYWVADAECGTAERYGHEMAGAASGMQGAPREQWVRPDAWNGCAVSGLGNAINAGPQGRNRPKDLELHAGAGSHGSVGQASAWSDFDLLPCTDGKSRRVESGTFPLAHGIPARMGRLRGYGNAIVPQVAAQFIEACMKA